MRPLTTPKRGTIPKQCLMCGKAFLARTDKVRAGKGLFCCLSCASRARAIAQHATTDQTGPNNPNWRDGISKDNYRYKKRQQERHPEAVTARNIVGSAIRRGRLSRKPCANCGWLFTEAHHADYSRPLDVVWLCAKCHRDIHRQQKAIKDGQVSKN